MPTYWAAISNMLVIALARSALISAMIESLSIRSIRFASAAALVVF